MTFEQAKRFVFPFGDYAGRTLDSIAATDEGLLYLDKIRGWPALIPKVKNAIDIYLSDPSIARELDSLLNH
jgi:hypothetical protein